jgi:hypothetical protein
MSCVRRTGAPPALALLGDARHGARERLRFGLEVHSGAFRSWGAHQMKVVTVVIGLVLLGSSAAFADAPGGEPLRMHDAAWIRDAGERLARCAGTYRGAAAVMRAAGQGARAADYAESVASGALFASYLLFTSPGAVAANVLAGTDPNLYIEALAWGTKRNFIELGAEGPAQATLLRDCTRTSALQSAVLRSSAEAPAAAAAQPKS